jgi:hypothetical protein
MEVTNLEELCPILSKYKGEGWKVVLVVDTPGHARAQGELSSIGEDISQKTVYLICQAVEPEPDPNKCMCGHLRKEHSGKSKSCTAVNCLCTDFWEED